MTYLILNLIFAGAWVLVNNEYIIIDFSVGFLLGLACLWLIQPFGIRSEIFADSAHGQRLTAQQFKVISNIGRTATEFAAHLRYVEGDIQNMHLVRKNVFFELVRKHHDGVVSQ